MQQEEKRYKVVVIPSWYPPRGGGFFREHSIALAEAGLEVHVLAGIETGLRDDPRRYFTSGKQIKACFGISEHQRIIRRIPLGGRRNAMIWVNRVAAMYAEFCKEFGHPDIILAHSSMWAGLAAARIKQQWNTPFVITEHRGRFTGIGELSGMMFKPWQIPLLREAFTSAGHIVTVSRALQAKIGEMSNIEASGFSCIPNMTDTDFFHIKKQNKNNKGPFTFLSVANHEPLKGLDVLIRSFAILREQSRHPVRLIIGGKGTDTPSFQKLVHQQNVQKDVICKGFLNRDQLLLQMQRADAFVLPSRFEAFGIVLIEAMACGLPLIATRSGGPEEIVTEECGILCEPDNPGSLAGKMQQMIHTLDRYQPERIRALCLNRYSKKTVTGAYIRLFEKILQNQVL